LIFDEKGQVHQTEGVNEPARDDGFIHAQAAPWILQNLITNERCDRACSIRQGWCQSPFLRESRLAYSWETPCHTAVST
jgi:hypothetical protein